MATNTITHSAARTTVSGNSFIAAFRRSMHRWSEQSRIRAELNSMSPRELADLGLNPSDIDEVARGTYRRAN